jgi:hypothetical protein
MRTKRYDTLDVLALCLAALASSVVDASAPPCKPMLPQSGSDSQYAPADPVVPLPYGEGRPEDGGFITPSNVLHYQFGVHKVGEYDLTCDGCQHHLTLLCAISGSQHHPTHLLTIEYQGKNLLPQRTIIVDKPQHSFVSAKIVNGSRLEITCKDHSRIRYMVLKKRGEPAVYTVDEADALVRITVSLIDGVPVGH